MFRIIIAACVVCFSQVHSSSDVYRGKDTFTRLVAKNAAPQISESGAPKFPDDYDWSNQDEVLLAIKTITSNIDDAWPLLADNLENESYSLTLRVRSSTAGEADIADNTSVAELCELMIWKSLVVSYREFAPPDDDVARKMHRVGFVGFNEFKEWCGKKRKSGVEFVDLQIEGCRWARDLIATAERLGAAEKQKAIAKLNTRISELQTSRKSIKIEKLFESSRNPVFSMPSGSSTK